MYDLGLGLGIALLVTSRQFSVWVSHRECHIVRVRKTVQGIMGTLYDSVGMMMCLDSRGELRVGSS